MAHQDKVRWTKPVADLESFDLSQRELAAERGVPLSNLRYGLYRLRKEGRPLVTEAGERSCQAPEQAPEKNGLGHPGPETTRLTPRTEPAR